MPSPANPSWLSALVRDPLLHFLLLGAGLFLLYGAFGNPPLPAGEVPLALLFFNLGVEIGIAVSGIVLGIMVAGAVRPPLWLAMLMVGAFAIFHGHAHGTELPNATDPLAYGVGFVTATGLLHLAGILLGILIARPLGERAVRAAGVLIAVGGGWFLLSGLGLLG